MKISQISVILFATLTSLQPEFTNSPLNRATVKDEFFAEHITYADPCVGFDLSSLFNVFLCMAQFHNNAWYWYCAYQRK